MIEHELDVLEVEEMTTIGALRPVEDARRAATKVVRREMPEAGPPRRGV